MPRTGYSVLSNRHHVLMRQASQLDFLEALDRYTRDAVFAQADTAEDMVAIAVENGLLSQLDASRVGYWTGELVHLGYISPRALRRGAVAPSPNVMWSERELLNHHGYRLTAAGREEAERIRRYRREQGTDVALGFAPPRFDVPWLTDLQASALANHLQELRGALEADRPAPAIGAAKDLLEATCKVVLEVAGADEQATLSLPTLFKRTFTATRDLSRDATSLGGERTLVQGLATAVSGLANLRNDAGSGHGRAAPSSAEMRHARLAASAAYATAEFLLASVQLREQRGAQTSA